MKFKLIFCFLVLAVSASAGSVDEGDVYFNNKQYAKARTVYEWLLRQRPGDVLYNYRLARCCYELKDYEPAIAHFEMSGNKFPMRDLYLGELYFNTYRFDESVMAYQTYMATLKPVDSKIAEYQQKIKKSEFGARLLAKVDDIAIVDSVVVSKSDFLRFYKFSSELGTLSQEGLKLTSRKTIDKIKYTTQRKDRVYFSDSIRGQMDIFTSYKLLDTWSEPASVSNLINTPANENYPFLLLDGITLYFASDGENSIGGYDLFVTRFNPSTNTYLAPENIGFPFNSTANDYMMAIDEQRKLGWFATDRNQSNGKVMIYSFVPNQVKTIIRSEDKEYIRRAAQLKIYRKIALTKIDSTVSTQTQKTGTEKQIEFIINDSVIYTHVNQFKSQVAVKLLYDLNKLSIDLNKVNDELTVLRTRYAEQEIDADRKAITQSILDLEKQYFELEKLISVKNIQIRNEENNYLSGRK